MRFNAITVNAFFKYIRAGLWEKDVQLLASEPIDFEELYKLAKEQSVVGIIAAGIEHVKDVKFKKDVVMPFMSDVIKTEQINALMNQYLCVLFDCLKQSGIFPVLVKGQGVAQCYYRPLWRSPGDIDLLLDPRDYEKAKNVVNSIGKLTEAEDIHKKHIGFSTPDGWVIELHGTLRCGLWKNMDMGIDEAQERTIKGGHIREWNNKGIIIPLPSIENDVIFIFTHILKHFFRGGIGLRQLCDWCRLMYKYRSKINDSALSGKLNEMGIMTEWKAFAFMAVNILGAPADTFPFYESSKKWKRKANRILALIIESGNFGNNRDYSYFQEYPYIVIKTISFFRHTWDSIRHFLIFPIDSFKVFVRMSLFGIRQVLKGQ